MGVEKLSCVFLNMYTLDAYSFFAVLGSNVDISVFGYGMVKLGDLIRLWQVGIKIVLSVVNAEVVYFAVKGNTCRKSKVYYSFVKHGERTGKSCANRTALGVWLCAKLGFAGAEYFGLSLKLCVYFESDDRLVCSVIYLITHKAPPIWQLPPK